MATDTQLTTFADLRRDLHNRIRATETTGSSTFNQAERYINIALHDMSIGFDYKFPWLERRDTLITHPTYETGTLSVNVGSGSLTGSSTLWNTNNTDGVTNMRIGGKIVIAGGLDIYRITAVASDTTATMVPNFVSGSNASAVTYVYFEDEYALASDWLRPVDFRSFTDAFQLPIIGRNEFRRRYPRPNIRTRPHVATILDLSFLSSTAPVRRLQLYPAPDIAYLLPYSYVTTNLGVSSSGVEQQQLSADTDEPFLPIKYRFAIVLHALYHWYRDKKDDQRSQEAKAEYTDLMLRVVGDQDIGTHTRAQIQPRVGIYKRYAERPYRRSGRFSTNNSFDRLQ